MKTRDHIIAIICIAALAVLAITVMQDHSLAKKNQDMTQFSNDLAQYMKDDVAKENPLLGLVEVTAVCKPNQGAYHTRCWITMKAGHTVDKATAENVRRVGDKFVWDRESQ